MRGVFLSMAGHDGSEPAQYIYTSNPRANYLSYKQEIDAAVQAVLDSTTHIMGPAVERFERQFAASVGVEHGIGMSTGTDALHLALRGLGIGSGDEVITVSHTSLPLSLRSRWQARALSLSMLKGIFTPSIRKPHRGRSVSEPKPSSPFISMGNLPISAL